MSKFDFIMNPPYPGDIYITNDPSGTAYHELVFVYQQPGNGYGSWGGWWFSNLDCEVLKFDSEGKYIDADWPLDMQRLCLIEKAQRELLPEELKALNKSVDEIKHGIVHGFLCTCEEWK